MTTTARPSNYGAQLAYRRDIAARGLAAVLAPYTATSRVTIPAQRTEGSSRYAQVELSASRA